jgi:hypothetical protein
MKMETKDINLKVDEVNKIGRKLIPEYEELKASEVLKFAKEMAKNIDEILKSYSSCLLFAGAFGKCNSGFSLKFFKELCYEADRVNKSPESIVFTWIFPTGGVL